MDRLTIRNSDGSISQPTHSTFEKVFNRLAEYEDTGLTPEEVKEMAENSESRLLVWFENKYGFSAGTLMDMCEAKQQGRLIVLPCKVGDAVWIKGDKFQAEIEQIRITDDGIYFDYTEYDRGYEETEVWDEGTFGITDIGKFVFLAREFADEALNEQKKL